MNRPERKLKNVEQKLATKQSLGKRLGKKAKRWRKDVTTYKPLVEATAAS